MEQKKTAKGVHSPKDRWILPVQIGIVAALLVWLQIAVSGGFISRIFVSSPSQILDELLYMLKENILVPNMLLSVQEFLAGYAISVAVGVLTGILFVLFPRVEKLFGPFVAALMAVPKIAIMPLLLIWFGIGFKSKVILVTLFGVFTVLYNTVAGARETPAAYLKVARIFRASRAQTVFKVLLPASLPGIFAGLRIIAGTGLVGVLFAETQVSKKGLGFLLVESQAVLNTPRIFVLIILVTVLAVVFVAVINLAEGILCRNWKKK